MAKYLSHSQSQRLYVYLYICTYICIYITICIQVNVYVVHNINTCRLFTFLPKRPGLSLDMDPVEKGPGLEVFAIWPNGNARRPGCKKK